MGIEQRVGILRGVRRVVVKIGSGVLSSQGAEELDSATLRRLVEDICALESDKRFEVILVSSGAVMGGRKYLNLPGGKLTIPQRQAAAAAGQMKLMNMYEKCFAGRARKVAQILLTHGYMEDRREGEEGRYFNIRNTINTLLSLGAVPIINENDSTAVDELKFGDNDTLAAKLTSVVEADLLLILSDVEGLYDSDPRRNPAARLIGSVDDVAEALRVAGDSSTGHGTGGMRAKVVAARIACDYGVPAWVISGKVPAAIPAAMREGRGGTFFHPSKTRLTAKEHWIRHILNPKGVLVVNEGAKDAIWEKGKSLLPPGIMEVQGDFISGDAVRVCDRQGHNIASGTVNYSADELRLIKGKKSAEIEAVLGYRVYDEVIHSDNMVRDENVPWRKVSGNV